MTGTPAPPVDPVLAGVPERVDTPAGAVRDTRVYAPVRSDLPRDRKSVV